MKKNLKIIAIVMFAFGVGNLFVHGDAERCFNFWIFALVAWGVSVSLPE